jgi:hypothetical protein
MGFQGDKYNEKPCDCIKCTRNQFLSVLDKLDSIITDKKIPVFTKKSKLDSKIINDKAKQTDPEMDDESTSDPILVSEDAGISVSGDKSLITEPSTKKTFKQAVSESEEESTSEQPIKKYTKNIVKKAVSESEEESTSEQPIKKIVKKAVSESDDESTSSEQPIKKTFKKAVSESDDESSSSERPIKKHAKKIVKKAISESDDESSSSERPINKYAKKFVKKAVSESDDESSSSERPIKKHAKKFVKKAVSESDDESTSSERPIKKHAKKVVKKAVSESDDESSSSERLIKKHAKKIVKKAVSESDDESTSSERPIKKTVKKPAKKHISESDEETESEPINIGKKPAKFYDSETDESSSERPVKKYVKKYAKKQVSSSKRPVKKLVQKVVSESGDETTESSGIGAQCGYDDSSLDLSEEKPIKKTRKPVKKTRKPVKKTKKMIRKIDYSTDDMETKKYSYYYFKIARGDIKSVLEDVVDNEDYDLLYDLTPIMRINGYTLLDIVDALDDLSDKYGYDFTSPKYSTLWISCLKYDALADNQVTSIDKMVNAMADVIDFPYRKQIIARLMYVWVPSALSEEEDEDLEYSECVETYLIRINRYSPKLCAITTMYIVHELLSLGNHSAVIAFGTSAIGKVLQYHDKIKW